MYDKVKNSNDDHNRMLEIFYVSFTRIMVYMSEYVSSSVQIDYFYNLRIVKITKVLLFTFITVEVSYMGLILLTTTIFSPYLSDK